MSWRGIIITGVSGGGKTTIARLLSARDPSFAQVTAVTTRAARVDDLPGSFEYLSDESFDALERAGSLIIRAEYRGKRYGITRQHLDALVRRGKAPLLLVTPKSLDEYLERSQNTEENSPEPAFLTAFIDAPDDVLDARLGQRGSAERQVELVRQRAEDRRYRGCCRYVLENLDLERCLEQLLGWWVEVVTR